MRCILNNDSLVIMTLYKCRRQRCSAAVACISKLRPMLCGRGRGLGHAADVPVSGTAVARTMRPTSVPGAAVACTMRPDEAAAKRRGRCAAVACTMRPDEAAAGRNVRALPQAPLPSSTGKPTTCAWSYIMVGYCQMSFKAIRRPFDYCGQTA